MGAFENIKEILGLPYTRLNWIEPGSFLFQGTKEVKIETGFYAGCFQVTQEFYSSVMDINPSFFKGRHRPVEQVSWSEANEFVKRVNEQTENYFKKELNDNLLFRLPSESQWEYAVADPILSGFNMTNLIYHNLSDVGWFKENSYGQTMPVGLKPANPFGLHDLWGNVWEWCDDNWNTDLQLQPNNGESFRKQSEESHVLRGGGCDNTVKHVEWLIRGYNPNNHSNSYRGFRLFRY